jgi:hypothetical protein
LKFSPKVEEYRLRIGEYGSAPGKPYGVFLIPGPCGRPLRVMATDGTDTGWEHASVSTDKHLPNWLEMAWVKDLFWDAEECVVQFHPPHSRYVNNWRVLHLWRHRTIEFPLPPDILVGIKELGTLA